MSWFTKTLFRIEKFFERFVHRLAPVERKEIISDIYPTAAPGFDYYLLVILSCSIATLGLITNSAAVIIGAMLLAPLMSPIIGLGLASIIGEDDLLKKSISALLRGAILAILLSFLMTTVNRFLPFVSLQELPTEVLARTHPTPIDLMIALAGGVAAAYALTRPNLSATLPGVAIATALMPPLCTIGVGLAMNQWDVASGATLLFVTNAITIAFAAAFVFFLRGFGIEARRKDKKLPHSLVISLLLVFILLVPLSYFSIKFFREASQNRLINSVVSEKINELDDAQLVDLQIFHLDGKLDMLVTIRTSSALRYAEVVTLQESIVDGLQMPVSLKLDQVIAEELDPLIPPTPTLTPTTTPTLTATATATPLPTSTPAQAQVEVTGLPLFQLYQSPDGPVIGSLTNGQWLTVLYGRKEASGIIWVEVKDEEGRIGWVPEVYIFRTTPTASPTP